MSRRTSFLSSTGARVAGLVRGGWLSGAVLLGSLLLAGCGAPSVEDICAQLDDQGCASWSGEKACVASGKSLQERVDAQGGCDGAFDEYRQCLSEEQSCSFTTVCAAERADLERCIGAL